VRRLLFGETWTVPLGVFAIVAAGLAASAQGWWHDAGGFGILLTVTCVLRAALR
jgi:hypothetical protein